MKYHVNSKTGRAGQCRATKKGCPLGSDTPHFDSKEEAQAFIAKEASQNNSTFPTVKKNSGVKTSRRGLSYSIAGVGSKLRKMGYETVKPVYQRNDRGPDSLIHYETKKGVITDGVMIRNGYPYDNITISQAINLDAHKTLTIIEHNNATYHKRREQGLQLYNKLNGEGVPVSINKTNGDVHIWQSREAADYGNYKLFKLPLNKNSFEKQVNGLIDNYKVADDTLKNISTYQTLEEYRDRALRIYDDRGLGSSRQREMNRFLEELDGEIKEEKKELSANQQYDSYGPIKYFYHQVNGLSNKIDAEERKKRQS